MPATAITRLGKSCLKGDKHSSLLRREPIMTTKKSYGMVPRRAETCQWQGDVLELSQLNPR